MELTMSGMLTWALIEKTSLMKSKSNSSGTWAHWPFKEVYPPPGEPPSGHWPPGWWGLGFTLQNFPAVKLFFKPFKTPSCHLADCFYDKICRAICYPIGLSWLSYQLSDWLEIRDLWSVIWLVCLEVSIIIDHLLLYWLASKKPTCIKIGFL